MRRRHFVQWASCSGALAAALDRAAAAPVARIAWLTLDGAARPSYNFTAFRAGMRGRGWVEGGNLRLQPWFADGSMDRVRSLIPELIATQPDLVVAASGRLVRPLIEARLPMPMLFVMSADVVEARFVESWGRPGVPRSGISLFST